MGQLAISQELVVLKVITVFRGLARTASRKLLLSGEKIVKAILFATPAACS
jgi:hypothetical protein